MYIRTSDVVIRDVSQTYDDSGKLQRINKIGLVNEPHGWRRGVTCRELVMDENTSRAAALNARPSVQRTVLVGDGDVYCPPHNTFLLGRARWVPLHRVQKVPLGVG